MKKILAIVLLLLLLWYFWPQQKKGEKPTSLIAPPTVAIPPNKAAPLRDKRYKIVEHLLHLNQMRLGGCVQKGSKSDLGLITLTMKWDVAGLLTSVSTSPYLGEQTEVCLSRMIRPWKIPAAPNLAPLSVSKKLLLRAR